MSTQTPAGHAWVCPKCSMNNRGTGTCQQCGYRLSSAQRMRVARGQGIGSARQGNSWFRRHPVWTVIIILVLLSAAASSASKSSSSGGGSSNAGQPPAPTKPGVTSYLDGLEVSDSSASQGYTLGALHIGRIRFDHGVSVHSDVGNADSPDYVTFALPGRFTSFRALVGFDPNATQGNSSQMGVKVFAASHAVVSTVVSTGSPPCTINVPITGARTIELGIYPSGNSSGQDVAFGDPRVVNGRDFARMPGGPPCP